MKAACIVLILFLSVQCSKNNKTEKKSGDAEPLVCTEMGCSDGFRITLEPTSGWRQGKYKFSIVHDGTTTVCEGELPLKPCGTPSLTCTAEGISIGESGCAIPADEQGFSDISSTTLPKSVEVQIEFEGAGVISKTFAFEYKEVFPNGPDCGGQCTQAPAETLKFSIP
jgi:hypothetical protein